MLVHSHSQSPNSAKEVIERFDDVEEDEETVDRDEEEEEDEEEWEVGRDFVEEKSSILIGESCRGF